MEELNLIIKTADHTRKAELTLDCNTIAGEIIDAAISNWNLPTDTEYTLSNATKGEAIIPTKTLKDSGVKNNDILEIQPVLVAGGTMSVLRERLLQDQKKLHTLSQESNGKISIGRICDSKIEVSLEYPTAPNRHYPKSIQSRTLIVIDLPKNYPLSEPKVSIKTNIYHPNVFASGLICLGTKWVPTEGLDLLVKRVVKVITFDPEILNEQSPANGEALRWYRETKRQMPGAFPTCRVSFSQNSKRTIQWNNM